MQTVLAGVEVAQHKTRLVSGPGISAGIGLKWFWGRAGPLGLGGLGTGAGGLTVSSSVPRQGSTSSPAQRAVQKGRHPLVCMVKAPLRCGCIKHGRAQQLLKSEGCLV